jgi:hypothetical protein
MSKFIKYYNNHVSLLFDVVILMYSIHPKKKKKPRYNFNVFLDVYNTFLGDSTKNIITQIS